MPNEVPLSRRQWLKDRQRDRLEAQVERYSIRAGEDAAELAKLRGALSKWEPLEAFGDPEDLLTELNAIYHLFDDGDFPYEGEDSLDTLVTSLVARLRGENERLRAVMTAAPHDSTCTAAYTEYDPDCHCWKQAALAGKESER